jgi:hypothetical protein
MGGLPAGLDPVEDLSPAKWVREALKEWPSGPFRVRDLVPPVFEAYARILHRPHRPTDVHEPTGSWAERALQRGRQLGPETTREDLGLSTSDPWSVEEGSLSEAEVSSLTRLLSAQGSESQTCWFALWSGSGFLHPGSSYFLAGGSPVQRVQAAAMRLKEGFAAWRATAAFERVPTFDLLGRSGRSYLLFEGVLADAIRLHHEVRFQSPNLWWPDDRAWLLHTEIDAVSTYLGGSRALVDRLVGEQVLESFEVEADSVAGL